MLKEEQKAAARNAVSHFYRVVDEKDDSDSITFIVDSSTPFSENNFNALLNTISRKGLVAFTANRDGNEIVILSKTTQIRDRFNYRLILFVLTFIAIFYFGYEYVVSYYGNTNLWWNLENSTLFYVLPVWVILISKEFTKFLIMKRNRQAYSFPIFVPDPIGMGTMGLINTNKNSFTSKRSMIAFSGIPLLVGFIMSAVILMAGSLQTITSPPDNPVLSSVLAGSGSPAMFQVLIYRFIPSSGILDPLAFAGWVGLIVNSFSALPLGYMDGGILASALLGKKSIILSYISILAIIVLGIAYPAWIVLAVFVLLFGLRGPEPLNNASILGKKSRAIAAVGFAIMVIGLVPLPYHAPSTQFRIDMMQSQVVIINGTGNSTYFNMSISNNGSSSISPAFQVSPSISFKAESNGKSIPPGSSMGYSLLFNTSRIIRDGIYDFNLSASSGTYKQTVPIKILMVNISQPVSFDTSNPLSENVTVGKIFTLDFMNTGFVGNNSTFSIFSIGESNFSYTLFTDSMQANITFRGTAQLALGEITLPEGKSYALDLVAQTNFTTWTIVGYNRNYQAAIAVLSEGPA
ncbi:MAG: zinc metalloprotease [Thermoplasmataceae archaeon]